VSAAVRVVAIDCSRVASAAEATALVAEARHAGAPLIERHNVAAIDARGEGATLDALAEDPTVRVFRRGPPPRGRLYQHERLRTRELEGAVIERAVAWRSSRDDRASCGLLWLRLRGGCWQRFFLDDGWAVWEEQSDADTERELEELAGELEELRGLAGAVVGVVEITDDDLPRVVIPELRIALASGAEVRLYPSDPRDPDADTLLAIR